MRTFPVSGKYLATTSYCGSPADTSATDPNLRARRKPSGNLAGTGGGTFFRNVEDLGSVTMWLEMGLDLEGLTKSAYFGGGGGGGIGAISTSSRKEIQN